MKNNEDYIKPCKSPITYVGGKYHMAKKIIPLFPQHKIYVEPFGGGAHVLCQKPWSKKIEYLEVYNDVNLELVNLFKTLQSPAKEAEIIRLLELTPHSREFFYQLRDGEYKPKTSGEDVCMAYRILVMMKQCFSGNWMNTKPSWSFNKNAKKATIKNHNFPAKIKPLVERLKYVQIEHVDFRDCIKKYDSPDTLFYCDPPYVDVEHYYKGSFGAQDHEDLAEMLNNIKGRAVVSYYDFDGMNEFYPPDTWQKHEFSQSKRSAKVDLGKEKPKSVEAVMVKR